MSWEYTKYEAVCEACGRSGLCIEGSDDWGRSSTRWGCSRIWTLILTPLDGGELMHVICVRSARVAVRRSL